MTLVWTTELTALRTALYTRLGVASMDQVPDAAAAQADATAEAAWKRFYALAARGASYDAAVAAHSAAAAADVAAFEASFALWRDGGSSSAEDFGVGIVVASTRADAIARYVEEIAREALVGTTPRPNLAKLPTGDVAILAPGSPYALGVPGFIPATWTEAEDRATGLAPATITLRASSPDRAILQLVAKLPGVLGSFLRAAVAASDQGPPGQVKITVSLGDYTEVYDRVDLRSLENPSPPRVGDSRLLARAVQVSTGVPNLGSNFAGTGWSGGYLAALEERLRLAKVIAEASAADASAAAAGGADAVPWTVPTDVAAALARATEGFRNMLARKPTHPRDRTTGPAHTIRVAEDALQLELRRSAECRAALAWPA